MKLIKVFIVFLLFGNCTTSSVRKNSMPNGAQFQNLTDTLIRDSLMKFDARPDLGFQFDYLIYLPKGSKRNVVTHLLVESTNTGANDTIQFHEKGARYSASKSSVGNYVSRKLKLPLLVPIFPRSATDWIYYTHALDRETLLSKGKQIDRLDLQLLAMIENARTELSKQQFYLMSKFFIAGFSASGTFANRFSLLHPEKLAGTASGGINSIVILPVKQLNKSTLNYPLGIADIKKITGKRVKLKAFKKLPKLLFMGELDDNDAVGFDDAYSIEERQKVYSLMGKHMAARWNFVRTKYLHNGVQADFRTYPKIGHGTDLKINNDIVAFFKNLSEN